MARHSPLCSLDVSLRLCHQRKVSSATKIISRSCSWRCSPSPASCCRPRAPWTGPGQTPGRGGWQPQGQSRPRPTVLRPLQHGARQHSSGDGRRHHVPQGSLAFSSSSCPSPRPPFSSLGQWYLVAITGALFSWTTSFIKRPCCILGNVSNEWRYQTDLKPLHLNIFDGLNWFSFKSIESRF